jgi:hypothetical protein
VKAADVPPQGELSGIAAAVARLPQPADRGRGREASHALTEVRTVLKRAESALAALDQPRETARVPKPPNTVPGTADMGEPPTDPARPEAGYDPDITDMRAALDAVVALLSPWRRTGSTTSWCEPVAEPPALDFDAIRARYARVEALADSELKGFALAAAAGLAGTISASDVPVLLEHVAALAAQLAAARGDGTDGDGSLFL